MSISAYELLSIISNKYTPSGIDGCECVGAYVEYHDNNLYKVYAQVHRYI